LHEQARQERKAQAQREAQAKKAAKEPGVLRMRENAQVIPGRFFYEYNFPVEFRTVGGAIRIKGQPQDVFRELHRCFGCNFPIPGAPRAFPRNDQYIPLRPCFMGICKPAPVKFHTNNAYHIELIAQPKNLEGKDSSVRFLFYTDRDGFLHLAVTAYKTHPPEGLDDIYKNQAFLRWQEFAQNLGRNLKFPPIPVPITKS
jgi:hypothetical protein